MNSLLKIRNLNLLRLYSTVKPPQPAAQTQGPSVANVKGLTEKCVIKNSPKCVPGTGKEYQVPEYYGFNTMSYHEAEVEMMKYRLPQPCAK